MASTSYQEAANQLFEAMDLITSKRVSALEFDKTLVCTIENADNAKNGVYTVSDGTSRFQAFTDSSTIYSVGAKVYVKVPNGDMDNQKIITGKYINEDTEYISYVSPLNSFIDITNNIVNVDNQFSLKANDDNRRMTTIWSFSSNRAYSEEARKVVKEKIDNDNSSYKEKRLEFYNNKKEYSESLNEINSLKDEKLVSILAQDLMDMTIAIGAYKGYERLGISGEFKTIMDSRTLNGSYGLRFDIYGLNKLGVYTFKRYYLDSSEMYGNPYKYSTFYKQEYLYDITDLDEIVDARLIFYQNSDFILEDGSALDPAATADRDDIFLKNPYVAFGYDLNNFNEDKVLLGTRDSLSYSNDMIPKERKVYMRWVHKDNDNIYAVDEEDEIPETAIIHWYRYKLEENRSDELAGVFWQEIKGLSDKFNYTFTPNAEADNDALKVIIEVPSRQYITESLGSNKSLIAVRAELQASTGLSNGIEEMLLLTNSKELEDKYNLLKAQYIKTDEQSEKFNELYSIITEERARTQYYSSEVLTFTNAIPQNLEAVDLIQSLTITVDEDNYKGVYRLYDETYHIINATEASKMRTLKASYSSVITGVDTLDSAEEITWYFPISNSMIHEPVEGKEYSVASGDEYIVDCGLEGYAAIKRYGIDTTETLDPGLALIETEQLFRIKDHYVQSASVNTIYCSIKKRGKIYQTSTTLLFGTTGSNGTDATLILKMYDISDNEVSALTIGDSIVIKPELYDYNNQPIGVKNIKYKWINGIFNAAKDKISTQVDGNEIMLTIDKSKNIAECQYYILEASVPYSTVIGGTENEEAESKEITLSAYLPISVRTSAEYVEIEGATKIVYDTTGVNPKYYKSSYKLFKKNLEQIKGVIWQGNSPDFDNAGAEAYFPVVSTSGEFQPQKMYYQNNGLFCVNALINNKIVWTQPIVIIQNRYGSAMLNNWDGNLTIDEKNGTILSAMMGAGIKNEDNSFSGVLMGQIGKAFEGDNIGLYGYNKGEQSFSLDVQGTATLGKSGSGQIRFDGNKGTITSGNYEENSIGMKIDLDDPFLKAYGAAGSFEMDLHAKDEEKARGKDLLVIKGVSSYDNDGKPVLTPMLNVGAEDYFLQSVDFSKKNYTGLNFNLTKGALTAYNFSLYTANKISDKLISSISINSNGNPYFKIHHASATNYENVPVFKVYEPSIYYYKVKEEYVLDTSKDFTAGRIYYDDNQGTNALNLVDKDFVYGYEDNEFYILNEDGMTEGFKPVPSYINNITYYSSQTLGSEITVLDDSIYYAFEPNKFYIAASNNNFSLDLENYYTENRTYYIWDEDSQYYYEVSEVLDNSIYRHFETEKSLGTLGVLSDSYYTLDTSGIYDKSRVYYLDSEGTTIANVVDENMRIFTTNTYYQKITQDGKDTYVIVNNYYSNMQYYINVITDLKGNQTATPVEVASPESRHYQNNTFYYFIFGDWTPVSQSATYNQDNTYGILIDGEYSTAYTITDSDKVYAPGKYYYIMDATVNYTLAVSFNELSQYYLDALGTIPVKVILETDKIKVFKENTFYRYYSISGAYVKAEGDYSSYITYYKLTNPEASEDSKTYQSVELHNGAYLFEPNKYYIYNEENDVYFLASQFVGKPYYIIRDEPQESDLVKITKNKFELKSHDWNSSLRTGMHLDISGNGGFIEGYSEYINTLGETRKPKFILDWRKNNNPIDVNNGVFRVKWNGETICTNIRATGGKIGGWSIEDNYLYASDIILQGTGPNAGIYVGVVPDNFLEAYSTNGASSGDDEQGSQLPSVTAILGDNDQFFRVDTKGNLQVYNASISNLVANKISTKSIWIDGRQYTYRKKKTLINVSVGTREQNIKITIPSIPANISSLHVQDPTTGKNLRVYGVVRTNAQTVSTTASLTTVSGKSSMIYYLGTGK